MARIRTVKPEFFRHEGLQDMEAINPCKYTMLVFEGLWGHCDKSGRFKWEPRQLKLDILPFLQFDMQETLYILEQNGFVQKYEHQGKLYGFIPSFTEHQRISGKEAQEKEKHPDPIGKQRGSTGEAPEKQNPVSDCKSTEQQSGSNGEALGKHLPGQEGNGVIGREGNGEEGPPSPTGKYFFECQIIKLSKKDYQAWKERFYAIPDFDEKLRKLDAWHNQNNTSKSQWFLRVENSLSEDHQKYLGTSKLPASKRPENRMPSVAGG